MHYFFKSSQAIMLRIASFSWLLSLSLFVVSFVVGSLIAFQPKHLELGLCVILGTCVTSALLFALTLLLSSKSACPLCRASMFSNKGAARRTKTQPILGSIRTTVALQGAFKGACYCPYCTEKVKLAALSMEERDRRR